LFFHECLQIGIGASPFVSPWLATVAGRCNSGENFWIVHLLKWAGESANAFSDNVAITVYWLQLVFGTTTFVGDYLLSFPFFESRLNDLYCSHDVIAMPWAMYFAWRARTALEM
jgi:hypothetical protein